MRSREAALLGTFDVARILGVTPAGVRWLSRPGGPLPCERTLSGRRLFQQRHVDKLVVERARQQHPLLVDVRPRMARAGVKLGQLTLPLHLGRRRKAKEVLHLGKAQVVAFRRKRRDVA